MASVVDLAGPHAFTYRDTEYGWVLSVHKTLPSICCMTYVNLAVVNACKYVFGCQILQIG